MTEQGSSTKQAIVLVARSAVAAAPIEEMERIRGLVAGFGEVMYAFTEQGEPSLRAVIGSLRARGVESLALVPLLLPAEPAFQAFLSRTIQRWQQESPGPWPAVRIAWQDMSSTAGFSSVLHELVDTACSSGEVRPAERADEGGSIVSALRRRVLVCLGGPCLAAGASVIWGHYRSEEKRLSLRTTGEGAMSAKASCLGPCSLAPVVQVFPEGTFYGGMNEEAVDRIVQQHLIHGAVVGDLAYAPSPTRQRLRERPSKERDASET